MVASQMSCRISKKKVGNPQAQRYLALGDGSASEEAAPQVSPVLPPHCSTRPFSGQPKRGGLSQGKSHPPASDWLCSRRGPWGLPLHTLRSWAELGLHSLLRLQVSVNDA